MVTTIVILLKTLLRSVVHCSLGCPKPQSPAVEELHKIQRELEILSRKLDKAVGGAKPEH